MLHCEVNKRNPRLQGRRNKHLKESKEEDTRKNIINVTLNLKSRTNQVGKKLNTQLWLNKNESIKFIH